MDIESKQTISISLLGKESDKEAAEVIKILVGGAAKGIVTYGDDFFGALLGDRIKEWRKRNFINSASKTAEFLSQKGVPLDKAVCLEDGEIYRLFDGASRADDEAVSDLWAGLLANAMDPDSEVTFDVHFTKVLEQLHSHDIKILDFIKFHTERVKVMRRGFPENLTPYSIGVMDDRGEYEKKMEVWKQSKDQATIDINHKYDSLNIDLDLVKNSIENLIRLGLVFLRNDEVDISTSFLRDMGWGQDDLIDNDRLLNVIEEIVSHMEVTSSQRLREQEGDLFSYRSSEDHIELMYDFTGFGERLIEACYID